MATGGPASQDAPDRVHTYALLRATIELSNKKYMAVWRTSRAQTYIKLHYCGEDGQEEFVPSFSIQTFWSGPVLSVEAMYTW